jgi:hypothetical protein
MFVACNSCMSSTKKKIIVFSFLGLAIATAYLVLTATNNPATAAAIPVFLPFATCPLMCAAIGGLMWFSRRRHSKSNNSHKVNHHQHIPITTNQIKGKEDLFKGKESYPQ